MSEGGLDVVVVGAGPVGLTLALGLGRAGRSVLVLEKEPSTAERSRAPAIWPGTQEVLAELGVVDRFHERGLLLGEVELWDADRDRALLRLPLRELADETDHPHLLLLPQSETERLLRREVERQSAAEIRFSAKVVGVGSTGDGRELWVEVVDQRSGDRERLRAPYVVGCDGAHSTVRESMGAGFDGTTYSLRAALADVRLEGGGSWKFPRLTTRNGLAVAVRMTPSGPSDEPGLWRLILPFAPDDGLRLDDRIGAAVRHLFSTGGYTTVWKSEFRLHRRVASRFVADRLVLAGDAAHLNSPVGGQGMNSGIRDARALVPVLVEALDRGAPETLRRYGQLRRDAVVEGVNRFTDRLTRALFVGRGRAIRPVLRVVSAALGLRPLRRRLLRRLAMLEEEA